MSRQHHIQHIAQLHGAVSQSDREESPNKEQVVLELPFAGRNMNLAYTAVQQVWPKEAWLFKRSAVKEKPFSLHWENRNGISKKARPHPGLYIVA